MAMRAPGSLAGWLPVTLDGDDGALGWRHFGRRTLAEPFFTDSLRCEPPELRRTCRTSIDALAQFDGALPPTTVIFHVSRCGSTLLTQLLATLRQCTVVSEPPVLDAFFRLHRRHPERSGGERILRGLIAALGRPRNGERLSFIKLDCWHMPWAAMLRRALPQARFVLLYRDPREVLASHRRRRGLQMVPGAIDGAGLEVDAAGIPAWDLDGYAAAVLDALYAAAFEQLPAAGAHLVNYRELPQWAWTGLLPACGHAWQGGELAALQARSRFHSKQAEEVYGGDPAGDSAIPAREWRALRCHEQLEALRRAQGVLPQLREGKIPSVQIT